MTNTLPQPKGNAYRLSDDLLENGGASNVRTPSPDEAEREYQHMMSDKATPEQRALGLEGLYYSARRRGDDVAAGAHAAQVLQLAPNSLWALDGLTALAVKHGDWPAVENWMRRWARAGVKRDVVRARRAIVYMAAPWRVRQ